MTSKGKDQILQNLKEITEISKINKQNQGIYTCVFSPKLKGQFSDCFFNLTIDIPQDFPQSAPAIIFNDIPYHININQKTGKLNASVLTDDWCPYINFSMIFQQIKGVLQKCDQKYCFDQKLKRQYQQNFDTHKNKIKQWKKRTQKFKSKDGLSSNQQKKGSENYNEIDCRMVQSGQIDLKTKLPNQKNKIIKNNIPSEPQSPYLKRKATSPLFMTQKLQNKNKPQINLGKIKSCEKQRFETESEQRSEIKKQQKKNKINKQISRVQSQQSIIDKNKFLIQVNGKSQKINSYEKKKPQSQYTVNQFTCQQKSIQNKNHNKNNPIKPNKPTKQKNQQIKSTKNQSLTQSASLTGSKEYHASKQLFSSKHSANSKKQPNQKNYSTISVQTIDLNRQLMKATKISSPPRKGSVQSKQSLTQLNKCSVPINNMQSSKISANGSANGSTNKKIAPPSSDIDQIQSRYLITKNKLQKVTFYVQGFMNQCFYIQERIQNTDNQKLKIILNKKLQKQLEFVQQLEDLASQLKNCIVNNLQEEVRLIL